MKMVSLYQTGTGTQPLYRMMNVGFYEDEEGDASYGWSLLDFMQGEYDDFTQMEIQQRIRSKMSKRDYIDAGSIQTTVNFDGHIYHIRIAFRRTDSNSEYNIDIESNGVEVIVE